MKRITALVMILALLVLPFAAQSTSLSDLGDKPTPTPVPTATPEPTPRPTPKPAVDYIPDNGTPIQFLGRIIFPDGTGLGYEFNANSSDPWKLTQQLIGYNSVLIRAGYQTPSFGEFEGEKQQYIRYSASDKPYIYLLPYLKKDVLIAIVCYDNDILDAFPEDMSAEDAYAALIAKLDGEDTRDTAAKMLAGIWKTSAMRGAVTEKITADNIDALMPALIRKDYYTQFSTDGETVQTSSSVTAIGKVIRMIIGSQETVNGKLLLAKKTANALLPAIDERYGQVTSLVWNNDREMQDVTLTEELPPIPAFDPDAERPKDLKDDGAAHKYVIVSEYNGTYRLMPYHSIFLPPEEIAESIEEADRIIVCHNYLKPSSGNWIGGHPDDSLTQINLYDAFSGSLICSVGFSGNYQGIVSHGGIAYDWIEMGEDISAYFADR
ncbi:MAG: hypothetical protein IKQ41_01135 [Clostridia bacterium]|nr:hypothetical protein [Clostridia bacterium]